MVYSILSDKIRLFNKNNGYVEVRTPVIWKKQLFEQSGHWDHFSENMFKFGMEDDDTYALKPEANELPGTHADLQESAVELA